MSSDDGSGGATQPATAAGDNQQPQQRGWGATFRAMLFQMMIFYAISSFFRSPRTNTGTNTTGPGRNMFSRGQEMELYIFLSEQENFTGFHDNNALIWYLDDLTFGSWTDGPDEDGSRLADLDLDVPEAVQNNGSWFLHVYLTKVGVSPNPADDNYYNDSVVYQRKLLTSYRQRRVNNKVNLLTGESDVPAMPLSVSVAVTKRGIRNGLTRQYYSKPVWGVTGCKDNLTTEVISYWHPNLTISVVDDQSPWQQGSIPPPLDKYIEFDNATGDYWPVLYLNDYWNLARDYQPLNDTTKSLPLHLSYQPLSVFRFQLYIAVTTRNQWWDMFGHQEEQNDEEQDTLKETLMDTNPYLLGLTMVVTLLHTVFEFLAFKNDVQFWRSRRSLEGLSARSVLFGMFQSVIVFLYILDNDTNMVVIISVFISLLIDCWKITKVVVFTLDRENSLLGVFPQVKMTYKSSYSESPTREYDMLAFKYLSWALFPLFLSYGVYSLLYHEHKGWYSFILSMCYGFLLTFGFIMMTPQLFINYKMKSVAHLPWRMLTYKALNTFIDDMFAFVIKMPLLYRIGCFRDDVVFFIYLYQRWIYPMDPHRINEFGTSADDQQPSPEGITSEESVTSEGGVAPEESGDSVEPTASFSGENSDVSLDENSSSETVELRRRLHRRED